jgi:hypothetical protein
VRIFLIYWLTPLKPFLRSSKFIAGWNSTLAPILKNGSVMVGTLSTVGTSITKRALLSPFSGEKYAASALLFSMKPCMFLRKFGSLTALFPASVGKMIRTMNLIVPFFAANILFKRSPLTKMSHQREKSEVNLSITFSL